MCWRLGQRIGASGIVYLIELYVKKKRNFYLRFKPIERTDREGMTSFLEEQEGPSHPQAFLSFLAPQREC